MSQSVYYSNEDIVEVNVDFLVRLKQSAQAAPLKRSRLCLHRDVSEQVHEMVIAFDKESYVQPHRHSCKSESFHVIEGELGVIFFDDAGRIIHKLKLGTLQSGKTFFYRLNTALWHTVVTLSDFAVIHETTGGPFIKTNNDIASWAPDESQQEEVAWFLNKMRASL